jgi:hypothetical protein
VTAAASGEILIASNLLKHRAVKKRSVRSGNAQEEVPREVGEIGGPKNRKEDASNPSGSQPDDDEREENDRPSDRQQKVREIQRK